MNPGTTASRTRTVTAEDIERFTAMTGDRNPLHYDAARAAATRFGGIVVQGGVTTGLAQRGRRRGPPRSGQRVPAHRLELPRAGAARRHDHGTVEVLEQRTDKPITRLRTVIVNQDGVVVVDGTALVWSEPLPHASST